MEGFPTAAPRNFPALFAHDSIANSRLPARTSQTAAVVLIDSKLFRGVQGGCVCAAAPPLPGGLTRNRGGVRHKGPCRPVVMPLTAGGGGLRTSPAVELLSSEGGNELSSTRFLFPEEWSRPNLAESERGRDSSPTAASGFGGNRNAVPNVLTLFRLDRCPLRWMGLNNTLK